MPRGDRTGPSGEGSKTGRAAGLCGGSDSAGFTNINQSFGGGRGNRKFGNGCGLGSNSRKNGNRNFRNNAGVGFGRGNRNPNNNLTNDENTNTVINYLENIIVDLKEKLQTK